MTIEEDSVYSATKMRHESDEEKTILLVDDDERLLRGLNRVLTDQNFKVLTAISPSEAHAVMARHSVDLVVSDNLMAGTLGTDFLAAVHETHPTIPLIMLSGYLPETVAARIMRDSGVAMVLRKPCEAADVARAIQETLYAVTQSPT